MSLIICPLINIYAYKLYDTQSRSIDPQVMHDSTNTPVKSVDNYARRRQYFEKVTIVRKSMCMITHELH